MGSLQETLEWAGLDYDEGVFARLGSTMKLTFVRCR